MANTVNLAYVKTYEQHVRFLAQQSITRLRPWVMEKSVQSEAHNWDRIAASAAVQKTARKVATPDVETVWSRRVSVPQTWHVGDSTEQEDIVQMIIDPKSSYAHSHGMALRRAHDDAIIAAATGTALDGSGGSNAFPAGQKLGTGIAAITFADFTLIQEKFLANDIDPDEEKVVIVGPKQARKMLQTLEMTSGDYNALRPLQEKGIVSNFMGFTIIVSTRLLSSGAGKLSCLAMTRKALGFQVNKDIWARVEEDPSISFAWRIYCASSFGAVRVEDQHIVHLEVLDS